MQRRRGDRATRLRGRGAASAGRVVSPSGIPTSISSSFRNCPGALASPSRKRPDRRNNLGGRDMMILGRLARKALSIGMAAAFATMLTLALTPSGASAAACALSIPTCGCTINFPGSYTLTGSDLMNSTGTCVDITASNVSLVGSGRSRGLARRPRPSEFTSNLPRTKCCWSPSMPKILARESEWMVPTPQWSVSQRLAITKA